MQNNLEPGFKNLNPGIVSKKIIIVLVLATIFNSVAMSQNLIPNPGFENYWPQEAKHRYFRPFVARGQPIPSYPTAFDDYVTTLSEEMERFDKPVAFLHGDTHLFRIDKPLYSKTTNRPFENFTRLETFGDPDTHWMRITIDPADAQLFRFDAQIVAGNAANRR